MDILNAETEWIENRCYRVIAVRNSSTVHDDDDDFKPVQSKFDKLDKEVKIDDFDIPISHTGNKFHTTLHVPSSYVGLLMGTNAKMKKSLEANGSTIQFPDRKDKFPELTISGPSRDIVAATCIQIQSIVTNKRLKEEFTHFISLPMNTPKICNSFTQFKKEILSKYKGVRGVHESIFPAPNKLHVTIVPVVLFDKRDIEQAEAILNKSLETVMKDFGEKQFIVQVKGVEYMNDDPAEVDVLYAKLHEEDGDTRLQVTVDKIMREFVAAKLSKDQHEKVKLHMTLMNTTYRDNDENTEESLNRVTFDARPILKDYIDYDFGQIIIKEIHISIRFTKGPDGYYIASCKKKLT